MLGVIVGGAVLAMAWTDRSAVGSENRGAAQVAHSDEVLESSYALERRVVDLETGLRGFEVTGDPLFLEPWAAARAIIPTELARLQWWADTERQRQRARELGAAITAYVDDYAVPIAREPAPPRRADLVRSFARGKVLLDGLRRRFDTIDAAELALRATRGDHARATASTVTVLTLLTAGVVMVAVAALVLYVMRAVLVPLRRLIVACARLSDGDRTVRLPAPNSELGDVSRAFNTMVFELQTHERELEEALAQVRDLADRDALTGLLNRRAFRAALEVTIARADRYGEHGAILMIDLDRFKAVNDTYGHAAGDALLIAVGETLRAVLRTSDVCGRLGGDEFAVILPHTGVAEAEIVAYKLREAIRAISPGDSAVHHASASVGIATVQPGSDLSADELMARADMAMYEAKRDGQDQSGVTRPVAAPAGAAGPGRSAEPDR